MKAIIDRFATTGFGILLQGILWLTIWGGPFYFWFLLDPRWGHNYAFALIFITVGLAYYIRKTSCRLAAVIAAFLIVPTEMAYWSWYSATLAATIMLAITIILYFTEKIRKTEIIAPSTRLRAWLKVHIINFAYLGLAHMPLIFFVGRWHHQEGFTQYLPIELEASTIVFNAMLLILAILGIAERYTKNIGRFQVTKIGFTWAILMIILPLLLIFAGLGL
jgi:hypothetical protein